MIKLQKRIQFVRQTPPSFMVHVHTLGEYLHSAGCHVRLISVEGRNADLRADPAMEWSCLDETTGRGWGKLYHRLRGGLRLRQYLKAAQFDILYVIDSWTLPTLWIATGGRMRWPRAKLVYHTFDWLEPGLVAPTHLKLEKLVCQRADLAVNADRARARLQRSFYGLPRTPLWVQNCISRNAPIPARSTSLRAEMIGKAPTHGDEYLVIYPTVISNPSSSQRMAWELIQAFRHLSSRHRLILFYSPGEEYERCRSAVRAAGLSDRIHFLRPVPFSRLMEMVASADLGIILYQDSLSSGYFMCNADKLSLFLACGLPYVASDQPNLESVTYRYRLGECCNAENPEDLARSIRLITEGSESMDSRRRRAVDTFWTVYNFETQGKKLLEALSRMDQECALG